MEYVLLRYRRRPDEVVGVAATASPAEAVSLARAWAHAADDEGLIVTYGSRAIVHCTPREA